MIQRPPKSFRRGSGCVVKLCVRLLRSKTEVRSCAEGNNNVAYLSLNQIAYTGGLVTVCYASLVSASALKKKKSFNSITCG